MLLPSNHHSLFAFTPPNASGSAAQDCLRAEYVNIDGKFNSDLLARNCARFLESELSEITPDDIHETWARFFPAVHGTTFARAEKIVTCGEIRSYRTLVQQNSAEVRNRAEILTDSLDIQLGLDNSIFLSLGRVNPCDIHPIYFVFRNDIIENTQAAVALREIAHFRALVSPEAVEFARRAHPNLSDHEVQTRNQQAAENFFNNVFSHSDFIDSIFPRFLQLHFPQIGRYSGDIAYPQTTLEVVQAGNDVCVMNAWDGPQVMVPETISLGTTEPAILITDPIRSESMKKRLIAAGAKEEQIFSVNEVLSIYQERFPEIGEYRKLLNEAFYLNMALRDIALMADYNVANENYTDVMIALKNRVAI